MSRNTEEPVRSHRNTKVVEASRLLRVKGRTESGRTLLEGSHVVAEALAAGMRPTRLFALVSDQASHQLAVDNEIELVMVDDRGIARLSDTKNPRGPVAVVDIPTRSDLDGSGILVSWGVRDPGNVGTMIRSAAAFAWDFAYTAGTADPWSPKVLRSAAGGHFHIGFLEVSSVEDLAMLRYSTVATLVESGVDIGSIPQGRHAVLVGDEAAGLPAEVVAQCDIRATIPMPGGTESLNAGVAAAVAVFALSTQ